LIAFVGGEQTRAVVRDRKIVNAGARGNAPDGDLVRGFGNDVSEIVFVGFGLGVGVGGGQKRQNY